MSNSSLDIQRSVPSLSGNFLRTSANLGKSYNLCTGGCIDFIHGNMSAICRCQEVFTSYSKQDQDYTADKASDSYLKDVNVIRTQKNLAACHSHDTQYLYSKQEQSFSDKSSFNCYSYVSQFEQFSYGHDIMNKTNMFSLNLVNETSWSLNHSTIVQKTTSIAIKSQSVNTIDESFVIVMEGNDESEEVHRSYGFIPLAIPEYYCTTEGSRPGFEPTKQWLQNFTVKLVLMVY